MSASEAFLYKALGTVTLTGTTSKVVNDANIQAGSQVFLSLRTVGGTPASVSLASAPVQGQFTITCSAGDTSTYSYLAIPPLYQ
jgi:hypothetical protein